MSRQIDLTKPLSDEDRDYLLKRDRHDLLAQNEAAVAGREYEFPGRVEVPSTLELSKKVGMEMRAQQAEVEEGDKAAREEAKLRAQQEKDRLAALAEQSTEKSQGKASSKD